MSLDFHNQIMLEYENRKKTSRELLQARTDEIYEKIPQIQHIDDEISINGLHYNKMILKGMVASKDASLALKQKTTELQEQKKLLLTENGYSVDSLSLTFHCTECKDTGYVDYMGSTSKCSCYKQLLIRQLYSQSNLKLTENENFTTFDDTLYSDKINEAKYGIKCSPRQNILELKERSFKFIANFEDTKEKNLYFRGPTGVGKTFLSNSIARSLLDQGRAVLYLTAPVLFDIVNEHKQKAFSDDHYLDFRYKNILNSELLIIDDLGTEPRSASRFAEFLTILNTRQINNMTRPCKTIISTNIDAKDLYEYYSERVASRIIGSFDLYRIVGNDIRMMKRRTSSI